MGSTSSTTSSGNEGNVVEDLQQPQMQQLETQDLQQQVLSQDLQQPQMQQLETQDLQQQVLSQAPENAVPGYVQNASLPPVPATSPALLSQNDLSAISVQQIQQTQNAPPPPPPPSRQRMQQSMRRGSAVMQGDTNVEGFNDDDQLDGREAAPPPTSSEPEPDTSSAGCVSVSTRLEYSALPSGTTQDVFGLATVQAAECSKPTGGEEEERQPMDIIGVLDVSGSMQGEKIRQVQDATRFIVEQADPRDRLGLVAFNSNATRVLRLRKMNAEGKNDATVATLRLAAGGGTSIAAGLDMALSVMERRRQRNKVSAILLLTDGQDGSTRGRLPQLLRRAAQANCAIYAFGFGRDHDAALLSEIAEQAQTPFTFVEDTDKIREAFAGTVGGLSSIVAQNVQLTLKCHVPLKALHTPFPVQQTEYTAVVTIPDMFASERRDILVELSVPAVGPEANKTELMEVSARYVDLNGNRTVQTPVAIMEAQRVEEPQPEAEPDEEVGAQRERVQVTQALQSAAQASDLGQFDQALHVIDVCDTRMKSSKKKFPVSEALGQELQDARERMKSRASWEQGGRAEIRDATQMHLTQRSTNMMQSERSVQKSAKSMYCNSRQELMIAKSKR